MMGHISNGIAMVAISVLLAEVARPAGPPTAPVARCAPDAVISGAGCMDKYEASVWRVPDPLGANEGLVRKIQQGKATIAMLAAGGAKELGIDNVDDYTPCAESGQNCADDVYAVSVPAVVPSANITWFQAQAACENARKRLPSNAEWQAAVAGTPDPGEDDGTTACNTASALETVATGSRTACVSARGAFDMVGNLYEWVADWVPRSTACPGWGVFSNDNMCFSGASTTANGPGALLRGGDFGHGTAAGPFTVSASFGPSVFGPSIGFRCAR
jgi:formylglycine-generating enzyme required for sulfatase activity